MYKKSFYYIGSLALSAMLLIGCAKYETRPLREATGIATTKDGVSISASLLNNQDCRHYFSRDAVRKGYQPILLTIRNSSKKSYALNAADISLSLLNRESVAKNLHLNTTKRVVSWGIGALFFSPFIIPAAIDGSKSAAANKALDKDFQERVIGANSRITVRPMSTVNKLMFIVPADLRREFDVNLVDYATKKTTNFTINL